jgi:hypothetical protein
MIISAPLYVYTLYSSLEAWSPDTWAAATTAGNAAYHPWFAPALLYELVAILGLLVFAVVTAILFFGKRTSAPACYIAFMVAVAVQSAVDVGISSLLPGVDDTPRSAGYVARLLISTLIWTAYFRKSERVRNTFVKRRVRTESVSSPSLAVTTTAAL